MCPTRTAPEISVDYSAYDYLTVHFQPIVYAKRNGVYGYEALTRPVYGTLNVKELFLHAISRGDIFTLDMVCRKNAFMMASRYHLTNHAFLFVNICPQSLADVHHTTGMTNALAAYWGIPQHRIILEITEETAIQDYELFTLSLNHYKQQGYRIAIDDFGSGYGGPKMLSLIKPHVVKLDRFFISHIDRDEVCRSFVRYTVSICHKMGILVVAEGVEREIEYRMAVEAGVDFMQGYYLGKPAAKPSLPRVRVQVGE